VTGYHQKSVIRALNVEPIAHCVSYCEDVNRGSYVNSLVLTDIASGWTEAAPLVVRGSGLLVETLEHIRQELSFALRALDVDNGSEFVNESLINPRRSNRRN
jgi:hypothetical protein